MKSITNIITLIAAIVLTYIITTKVHRCNQPEIQIETKIDTFVKIDTIIKVIDNVIIKDPIIKTITKIVKVPYADTTRKDSVIVQIPENKYIDTIEIDGAKLTYDHDVSGWLLNSKYSISYPRITNTIEKTIEKTIIKEVQKKRMFDVFGIYSHTRDQEPINSVGLDVVFNKWKIGYRYGNKNSLGPIYGLQKTHTFEIGFRIFEL